MPATIGPVAMLFEALARVAGCQCPAVVPRDITRVSPGTPPPCPQGHGVPVPGLSLVFLLQETGIGIGIGTGTLFIYSAPIGAAAAAAPRRATCCISSTCCCIQCNCGATFRSRQQTAIGVATREVIEVMKPDFAVFTAPSFGRACGPRKRAVRGVASGAACVYLGPSVQRNANPHACRSF